MKSCIYYRFFDLYSVYRNRYGRGIRADVYGYDDVTADDDLASI